ncbi:hypothetical protein [uncultured Sphingomonas sp.]|uniref:hypothetical protein n=1 Tax=uncultured Sphingomonas sp. TaxID=158754 RepID=UPI0025D59F55|nr:hypothetical protein [uncultured Sphingomonas sp.]
MAAHTHIVSPINAPSRGRRVQIGINDLKTTIDGALVDGGKLMGDIITAGQQAGTLPQTSQRAIERMHECLRAGIEMRALAIATHHDLRKIMGQTDLEAVGFGDLGHSPV